MTLYIKVKSDNLFNLWKLIKISAPRLGSNHTYKVCNVFVTTSEKVEKSMMVEGSENTTSAFPAELLLNINLFSQQFSN